MKRRNLVFYGGRLTNVMNVIVFPSDQNWTDGVLNLVADVRRPCACAGSNPLQRHSLPSGGLIFHRWASSSLPVSNLLRSIWYLALFPPSPASCSFICLEVLVQWGGALGPVTNKVNCWFPVNNWGLKGKAFKQKNGYLDHLWALLKRSPINGVLCTLVCYSGKWSYYLSTGVTTRTAALYRGFDWFVG